MYIVTKQFKTICNGCNNRHNVFLIESKRSLEFQEVVEIAISELSKTDGGIWGLTLLSDSELNRSAEKNWETILNAHAVIAECSDEKPNIYFQIGLAHSIGKPVCSCYKKEDKGDHIIYPFNVQGRQHLNYSLQTEEDQEYFIKQLIAWLRGITNDYR